MRSALKKSEPKPMVARRGQRSRAAKTEGSLAAGGPLSRELTTVKMVRLVDFMNRSGQLAFTRISGLSDFQWRVVARVNELEPLSINELSGLLQRDMGQVSRTVKAMVAAGLLHRASRKGGPGVLITPTALGRSVYAPLRRLARKRNDRIISGLSEDEMQTLEHCMGIMARNAQALLAQEVTLARKRARNPIPSPAANAEQA